MFQDKMVNSIEGTPTCNIHSFQDAFFTKYFDIERYSPDITDRIKVRINLVNAARLLWYKLGLHVPCCDVWFCEVGHVSLQWCYTNHLPLLYVYYASLTALILLIIRKYLLITPRLLPLSLRQILYLYQLLTIFAGL